MVTAFTPKGTFRDRFALVLAVFYFSLSTLLALNIVPITSLLDGTANADRPLSSVFAKLESVPYVERVTRYMAQEGATSDEIAAKNAFLLRSYLVMISGYAMAAAIYAVALVACGVGDDPLSYIFTVFHGKALGALAALVSVLFGFCAFMAWLGADGVSAFEHEARSVYVLDFTPQHNVFIVENIVMMSLSLYATFWVLRFVLGFLYTSLGGKVSEPN